MFFVNAVPQDNTGANLELLRSRNSFITKIMDDGQRSSSSAAQASGYSFGDNTISVGASVINSILGLHSTGDALYTAAYGDTVVLTTYGGNTPQMRVMVPINVKDGASLSGFFLSTFNVARTGSGITGTFTVRLCKMSSGGTVTTIATGTVLIPDSAGTKGFSMRATGSPVSFTSTDFLVLELEIAQTSGTHNTTNYSYATLTTAAASSIFHIF